LVTFEGDFADKTVKSVHCGVRISVDPDNPQPIEALLEKRVPKGKKGTCPEAMVFNPP
jgi:hypothetical protein